jgi:2-dehydropantoate 2-reductase
VRIAIVGAGAVGCAYGYRLAESGQHVTLIDVWAEHVSRIEADGLRVASLDTEHTVAIEASTDMASAVGAEVVIMAVKAFSNEAAAHALSPTLDATAIVVTVQNGIGNDARLAALLGAHRVVQASTTVGAEILGPGRVRVTPGTADGESRTVLGRPPGAAAAVAARFAAVLDGAGLPAAVVDDVREVVWRKAVFAAAIGPLCATLEGTVADLLRRPTAVTALRRAFAEIVAVAGADPAGIALDLDEMWDQGLAVYRSIGDHPPSLAVDVARGRPTEIDAQLGEICRRAVATGVATPVCDVLLTLVAAREPTGGGGAGDGAGLPTTGID